MIALFMTSSSSSSWYFLSHVGLDLGPLSQNHFTKDMLPMKIYPHLSDRRKNKRNRRKERNHLHANFNFYCFGNFFLNHDVYPNPRPTTSTHSPLPTTHDTYLHSVIMYSILFLLSCLQPKSLGISSTSIISISTWNDKLFFNQSFSNL